MKKKITTMILSLSLLSVGSFFAGQALAADAKENSQTITRDGYQTSSKGSAEFLPAMYELIPYSLKMIRHPILVVT